MMKVDPGCTRKSLTNAAKHLYQEQDDHHNLSGLQQLEKQGHIYVSLLDVRGGRGLGEGIEWSCR